MATAQGMIHGRFQPFHHGHLEYALAALDRCDHLIVGITNPDPSAIVIEAMDPDRHRPEANVFTYFERQRMIRAALAGTGITPDRFTIVPFPIHHPDRWHHYAPAGTVQYLRVFSPWGGTKADRLRAAGYPVEVIHPDAAKQVSGRDVREALIAAERWEDFVPPAVAAVLREIDAPGRLRTLLTRSDPAAG